MIQLVLAGSYEQYCTYCHIAGRSPRDSGKNRFVFGEHCLLGMANYELVKYGTWRERQDAKDILQEHEFNKATRKNVKDGTSYGDRTDTAR